MKNKLFILAIAFFVSTGAFAQDVIFRVLASKGGNQSKAGTSAKNLYVGSTIKNGESVVVPANGYLGLAYKTGKTIEIKTAGTYTSAKLISMVGSQNSSSAQKYANYIASEVSKSDGESMSKNKYKYMKVTGSVVRHDENITINAPDRDNKKFLHGGIITGNEIYLNWKTTDPKTKTFVVEVYNMFDEAIFHQETSDSTMLVKLPENLDNNSILRLMVFDKDNKEKSRSSEFYSVKYVKDEKLIKETNELKSSLGEMTPLNLLVMAGFYEENNMYFDALRCYEEAIKKQPDVEDFQVARGMFFERTNAKPENNSAK